MGFVIVGAVVLAVFLVRVALFRRAQIMGGGRRLMGPFASVRRIARRRRWR